MLPDDLAKKRQFDRIRPSLGDGGDAGCVQVRPANGGDRATPPAGVLDQSLQIIDRFDVVKQKSNPLHAEVGQLFDERKHLSDAERLAFRLPLRERAADVEGDEAWHLGCHVRNPRCIERRTASPVSLGGHVANVIADTCSRSLRIRVSAITVTGPSGHRIFLRRDR
jgi:hypothetical protein